MGAEAKTQAAIMLEFGARPGIRLWRANVVVARSRSGGFIRSLPTGHPDIAGILSGGRALYIEVKSPTGRLSKDQRRFRDMAESLGALWILARSVADVETALNEA